MGHFNENTMNEIQTDNRCKVVAFLYSGREVVLCENATPSEASIAFNETRESILQGKDSKTQRIVQYNTEGERSLEWVTGSGLIYSLDVERYHQQQRQKAAAPVCTCPCTCSARAATTP